MFHDVVGHEDVEAANYPKVRAGLGRVGITLVQSYSMVFDYSGKTLTLFSDQVGNPQRAGCFGVRVPFAPKWEGAPVSTVQTDLGDLTFMWDTGVPGNFIAERLLPKHADDGVGTPFVIAACRRYPAPRRRRFTRIKQTKYSRTRGYLSSVLER
jgi:hypothetical protein